MILHRFFLSPRRSRWGRLPSLLLPGLLLGLAAGGGAAPLQAQEGLHPFVQDARPLLDARLRYERVDQGGFEENANGLTLRARLGFESGRVSGFRVLVEGDLTRALGIDDFNSTVSGRTAYPVIADPDSERINRLHLTWEDPRGWSAVLGRQRIIHDNARFVGNVGFRQNEQTFDAVRFRTTALEGVTLDYSYLWQTNRINGSNSPVGQVDTDTHLLRAAWALPVGTLGAHAYWVELDDLSPLNSNRTLGLRLDGSRPVGEGWQALYSAGWSRQGGHGDRPGEFTLDFWELDGGVAGPAGRGRFTLRGGVETLGGDREGRGFVTPLATLHLFQGFADVFLSTPPGGLQDRRVRATFTRGEVPTLGSLRIALAYHDFERNVSASEAAGGPGTIPPFTDLGREWNVTVAAQPRPGVTLMFEWADYEAADGSGVRKGWLSAAVAIP